jgi:hypothetical protein
VGLVRYPRRNDRGRLRRALLPARHETCGQEEQ